LAVLQVMTSAELLRVEDWSWVVVLGLWELW
jgi:hypothetical protein